MDCFAKVTSKAQVVIPKEVRKLLNVGAGDTIVFSVESGNEIKVRKVKLFIVDSINTEE